MKSLEAIAVRVSTRTFDNRPLSQGEIEELKSLLDLAAASSGPFGHKIKLGLSLGSGEGKPARMGTYGLISGAQAFAAAAVAPGPGSMEDLGWILEGFVLGITALGWASCWIGGLFSRGAAAGVAGAAGGDLVPAVVALGRTAPRRSLADRIVGGAARARTRKPLKEIAFSMEAALPGPWLPVLEAVRIAPSASNKQPWRLVWHPETAVWTLFLDEDRAYNHALGAVRIQNIDLGIAMRHFALAASELGLPGAWREPETSFQTVLDFGSARGWKSAAFWK
ncbi:MAG: hypothetical protein NT061_10170 [Spirochaetes bacterium]|nr:hypothetical protein [Spirochaetota bacterium]